MPTAPPVACTGSCNGRTVVYGGDKCDACRRKANQEKHSGEISDLYRLHKFGWGKFCASLKAQGNIICQKITDGVRCPNLAAISHHLISPKEKRELFLSPANVIRLCRDHHPDTPGTPHWKLGVDYVPTIYKLMGVDVVEQLPEIPVQTAQPKPLFFTSSETKIPQSETPAPPRQSMSDLIAQLAAQKAAQNG
jgi:hypothetical protein